MLHIVGIQSPRCEFFSFDIAFFFISEKTRNRISVKRLQYRRYT